MLDKIRTYLYPKILKMRYSPIRVFCFHQVSDKFDENSMYRMDWLQTDDFKRIIQKLRNEGYTFISLPEAHTKIMTDKFRVHKYAVLTADDGSALLKNVLPWLKDQQIPITLFLNPLYLDGKHYRERETEQYLSQEELYQLCENYPLITIGSHGWEHRDITQMTEKEFEETVTRSANYLSKYPNYIPYYAFTWGRYTNRSIEILRKHNLYPVLMNGKPNIQWRGIIERENLDKQLL